MILSVHGQFMLMVLRPQTGVGELRGGWIIPEWIMYHMKAKDTMALFISFQNIPAMVSLAFMWYMIHSGMIHPPLSSPTPVRGPSTINNITGRLPETIAMQRCQI